MPVRRAAVGDPDPGENPSSALDGGVRSDFQLLVYFQVVIANGLQAVVLRSTILNLYAGAKLSTGRGYIASGRHTAPRTGVEKTNVLPPAPTEAPRTRYRRASSAAEATRSCCQDRYGSATIRTSAFQS